MWGFGYDATSAVQIKERCKHFKVGGESAESDPRSGRPATSRAPEDVERVWGAVNNDGWLTVWETDLGIPKTTVSEILMQDLGMKRVMAKFVLWLLLPEQKEHWASVANDMIQTATKWTRFSHNQKWIVGLQLCMWSGNKGPVIPVEVAWHSKCK